MEVNKNDQAVRKASEESQIGWFISGIWWEPCFLPAVN